MTDVKSRSVIKVGDHKSVPYATLSYVCGPAYTVRVLKDGNGWVQDESGAQRHALPQSLQQTLEDAMVVTASIKLRYL